MEGRGAQEGAYFLRGYKIRMLYYVCVLCVCKREKERVVGIVEEVTNMFRSGGEV